MLPSTIIHSASTVDDAVDSRDHWFQFCGERIVARGTGSSWRERVAEPHHTVDAQGKTLVPGFIDMHCHGGGGAAVEDGTAGIQRMLDTHMRHGTTRSVCSLVSAPVDDLASHLTTIAEAARADPRILGAHLEGPFLERAFRGAHSAAALQHPHADRVERLLAAAEGMLAQVTIAPEHDPDFQAIRAFRDAGVAVAVGHTGADLATSLAAFDAGATILTHAFNGMPGIHHREPGPVVAAIRSGATLEIINDGVHVHPSVVRLAFDSAPHRIALITDAMAAAGAPNGDYLLGSVAVHVSEGVARTLDTGSIAGSTLTLDSALRHAVIDCDIPLAAAIDAVTVVPAQALGRSTELGQLDAGFIADAVLLEADLSVAAVWIAGVRRA